MATTLTSQLTSVRAAIAKIEAGAISSTIEGMTVTRADLATLYARERELLRGIAKGGDASDGYRVCEF